MRQTETKIGKFLLLLPNWLIERKFKNTMFEIFYLHDFLVFLVCVFYFISQVNLNVEENDEIFSQTEVNKEMNVEVFAIPDNRNVYRDFRKVTREIPI